jgi:hypothetical protein
MDLRILMNQKTMPICRFYIRGVFWKSVLIPLSIMKSKLHVDYFSRAVKLERPLTPDRVFEFVQYPTDQVSFNCMNPDATILFGVE